MSTAAQDAASRANFALAQQAKIARGEARYREFVRLRGSGHSIPQAAYQIGVGLRQGYRYERRHFNELKAQQGEVDERQIDRRPHRVETYTSRRGSDRQGVPRVADHR